MNEKAKTTLADLFFAVQDSTRKDEEVVAVIAHLLERGQVRRPLAGEIGPLSFPG